MTLKLSEDPNVTPYGNALHVEPFQGDSPGATFIVMCGWDQDPGKEGNEIILTREQTTKLRDYLNKILT